MFHERQRRSNPSRGFARTARKRRPKTIEDTLCPECGDRLVAQGYCSVCEHFWRLAVDDLCPKHDIPLEPGPPPSDEPIASDQVISWVTVKVFPGQSVRRHPAEPARGRGHPHVSGGRADGGPGHVSRGHGRRQAPGARRPGGRGAGSSSLKTGRFPAMKRPTLKTFYEAISPTGRVRSGKNPSRQSNVDSPAFTVIVLTIRQVMPDVARCALARRRRD